MNVTLDKVFDMNKMISLGLYDGKTLTSRFYNAYRLYSIYLLKYLDRAFFLSKYDFKIRNNPLHIKPVKEQKDYYEQNSYLKFFYIRNNLHIENLSEEQINMLNDEYINETYKYDKNVINFIESTYQKVLNTNKLLLGVTFDPEFEKEGMSSWKEKNNNIVKVINEVCDEFLKENKNNPFNFDIELIKVINPNLKKQQKKR